MSFPYVDYSNVDDSSLLALIAQANSDALGQLYDRYSGLIFSLALNIVGDRGAAEEIVLDVFSRVWEKAGTYRADQAKVTTWLTTITRNRSIDVQRQQNSRPKHNNVSWSTVSSNDRLMTDGPEKTVELSIQRDHIRRAVAELPPNQQEALALAYFKEYTHREIAEVLDQPLGTVKTRIRLAMQKLRQVLQYERIST